MPYAHPTMGYVIEATRKQALKPTWRELKWTASYREMTIERVLLVELDECPVPPVVLY